MFLNSGDFMTNLKKYSQYFFIVVLSGLSALNYAVFIFPNSFAPAGIDGICTMIQDIIGVSMGYLSLILNIPLIIVAFFLLNRNFAARTTLYVVSFSIVTVILRHIDISEFIYHTDTNTSIVLAPIAAGAIRGILYAATLRLGASSGGTDIVAAVVKRFRPYLNLMNVIFAINMVVALCSYFVYGFKLEPVICSIIYSFITSSISNHIRENQHSMVKFEIISVNAEELCMQIFKTLHRTATIMEAQGAYSGESRKMIVCVIEKEKAFMLEELLDNTENTVFFKSSVTDLHE